jgi:hypothetical protein
MFEVVHYRDSGRGRPISHNCTSTSLTANYYSVMNYNELLIRATELYYIQQRRTAIVSVFRILNWQWILRLKVQPIIVYKPKVLQYFYGNW